MMSSTRPNAHSARAPNTSQPGAPQIHPTHANTPTTGTPPSSATASLCRRSLAGLATQSNCHATRLANGIAAAAKSSAMTGLR